MSTTIEVKGDDVIEEEEIQDVSSVEMEDHPSDMIIVLAERKRVGVPQRSSAPTIEERLAILQQVKSRIKTMIAEDIPLFTMEGIRDVHEQVQKCMAQGGKGDILVKGLDGIMVRFQLHIGQTYDWADYISVNPVIEYVPMQHLISEKWVKHRDPELAFCNLVIYHRVKLLEKERRVVAEARHAGKPKEEVGRDVDNCLHEWVSSEQCKQLQNLDVLRKDASQIKKIVAFACGSITHCDDRSKGRSCYQHGLIKTLREILTRARQEDVSLTREQRDEQIQCFIQDPAYTDIDREILQDDYGIATIIENPEGFLEVDDSTLVLSFSPNVPVRQIVVDIAKPAAMIWDRIWDEDKDVEVTDPDSSRVRCLIDGFYDQVEFPEDKAHFGDIAIYRRRA
ncbi:hypothetical protein EYB26_006929 [Talaromyces marneffei]|uniref:uncharacterized protein n=1 Tax=Talaromyces marneffei TaxID=37727 RepID=UPI0012A7CAF4|nr:uncharacterized protein EYB26_006929 [Talaromyces marneffei]QGA19241.1 hypothetical protein EYB26_006929 [Talaromyces marneffei]